MPMDEKQLLSAIDEIVSGLRGTIDEHRKAIDAKCDAIDKKLSDAAKKRADTIDDVGERRRPGEMAEPVAADSRADAVGRGELAALAQSVGALNRRINVPVDRDKLAEEQSRCDHVARALGSRAEGPMMGETNQAYSLRLHREFQRHSAKWKGVDLASLANDNRVLENVLAEIRADALQEGLRPTASPPFQHRMREQNINGHIHRTWHGTGTIFAAMSPPVRKVVGIGHVPGFARSAGGSMHYDAK